MLSDAIIITYLVQTLLNSVAITVTSWDRLKATGLH